MRLQSLRPRQALSILDQAKLFMENAMRGPSTTLCCCIPGRSSLRRRHGLGLMDAGSTGAACSDR